MNKKFYEKMGQMEEKFKHIGEFLSQVTNEISDLDKKLGSIKNMGDELTILVNSFSLSLQELKETIVEEDNTNNAAFNHCYEIIEKWSDNSLNVFASSILLEYSKGKLDEFKNFIYEYLNAIDRDTLIQDYLPRLKRISLFEGSLIAVYYMFKFSKECSSINKEELIHEMIFSRGLYDVFKSSKFISYDALNDIQYFIDGKMLDMDIMGEFIDSNDVLSIYRYPSGNQYLTLNHPEILLILVLDTSFYNLLDTTFTRKEMEKFQKYKDLIKKSFDIFFSALFSYYKESKNNELMVNLYRELFNRVYSNGLSDFIELNSSIIEYVYKQENVFKEVLRRKYYYLGCFFIYRLLTM